MTTTLRFAVLALVLLGSATLSAHPTAESSVVIRVAAAGVVSVDLTTNARALKLKLGAETFDALPASVHLRANGARVELNLDRVNTVADRPELVVARLRGTLPADVRSLIWDTPLFLGTYPLAVVAESTTTLSERAEDYEWINGGSLSRSYDPSALVATTGWSTFRRMIGVGFSHIVPGGVDHVLFVLGLFLLSANVRSLLLQITAFTLAHSLTLALAVTGWVNVPAAFIEPLIALSIVYVAIENLTTSTLSKRRLAVVFLFGLLHGLGFAGALAELGLGRANFFATLLGFNIGVELGQLAVVGLSAGAVAVFRLRDDQRRTWVVRPASVTIAAAGIFWAIERLVA